MKKKRLSKKGKKNISKIFLFLILIVVSLFICLSNIDKKEAISKNTAYLSSYGEEIILYDDEYNEVDKLTRGVEVLKSKDVQVEDKTYSMIEYNNKTYYVLKDNVVSNKDDIIKEEELFVRTNLTLYKDDTSNKILSYIKKGESLEIIGYDNITEGVVNKYKVKYNDLEGYVYSKYLVSTKEEAESKYSENGILEYMDRMGDTLGGGNALELDYYPYEKPSFEDNVMPDDVRSLYINSAAVQYIDDYIEFALANNINAFVIDIKDNTSPAYNSPVMEEYSKTNYDHALNEYEDYKSYIKKAKDAGIYLIGRITTFKDSYYIEDHPEAAITNNSGTPFSHNGSYWPSAYNRSVWEFNVSLALEAVKEIGFNEIQFDYVRFPDRTMKLENSGTINLNNTYNETKASALQTFVMYACDQIHEAHAYVSIDVFGESASDYVTAYGQFWPAISNVADVISGMPYPDHFNAHEYGISEVVWTVPYKLLYAWGSSVKTKQDIIPTPARVRTWIQTYNATKEPYVVYDSSMISEQIQALYDNGLTGGYMTWNSGSNLSKYREVSSAFRKDYK